MKRTALTSTLLIVLTGCASHWVKPGATQEDFANDKQFCSLYAKAMNDNHTWSSGFSRNSITKQCMEERGWTKASDTNTESTPVTTVAAPEESRAPATSPVSCKEQCDSLNETHSLKPGMDLNGCYAVMCNQ